MKFRYFHRMYVASENIGFEIIQCFKIAAACATQQNRAKQRMWIDSLAGEFDRYNN